MPRETREELLRRHQLKRKSWFHLEYRLGSMHPWMVAWVCRSEDRADSFRKSIAPLMPATIEWNMKETRSQAPAR